MRFKHHLAVMLVALALPAAHAQDTNDPAAAARASYQAAWAADQRVLESAILSLNGRFRTAVERVREAAQERGDLNEALSARELVERMAPLVTNPVFRSGGGVAQVYLPPALPDRPGERTQEAFNNYLAKLTGLVDPYNLAASNRHTQLLAAYDAIVRELTRRGALASALKVREERETRAAEGAPRLLLTAPPAEVVVEPELAESEPGSDVHPAIGSWSWPAGLRRVLRPDRVVECYDARGQAEEPGRLMLISPDTVDIRYADGHYARCRLVDHQVMEVTSRLRDGTVHKFRAEREDTRPLRDVDLTAPAPVAVEPVVAPAGDKPHAIVGRWRFANDVYAVRVFAADGNAQYLGDQGQVVKAAPYFVIDDKEVEIASADGWIDQFQVQANGTLKLEAKHATKGSNSLVGRREAAAPAGPPGTPP